MDFGLYKTWNYMLCVCCPLVMTRLILTTSADVKLVKYSRTLLNLGKTAHCSWCHNGEIKQKCDIKLGLGLARLAHGRRQTTSGMNTGMWMLQIPRKYWIQDTTRQDLNEISLTCEEAQRISVNRDHWRRHVAKCVFGSAELASQSGLINERLKKHVNRI